MSFPERKFDQIYWPTIGVYLVAGVAAALFIQLNFPKALRLGLAVTDVSALAHSLSEVYDLKTFLYIKRYDLGGLMLLYAPAYRISPSFYPTINALLFAGAALVYKRLIVDQLPDTTSQATAIIGLLGNPFFLLNMPGPNKELPLLLLTLLLALLLVEKATGWIWKSALVAIAAFFFRDGYGALLLMFVAVYYVVQRWSPPASMGWRMAAICLAISLGVSIFAHALAPWLPFVQRNLHFADHLSPDIAAAGDHGAWALLKSTFVPVQWMRHLVLNASSLILFPALSHENGSVYWIGVSYAIFGHLNLVAFLFVVFTLGATIRRRLRPEQQAMTFERTETLSAMWLALFLLMTASSYTQPRYQMTILPLGLAGLSLRSTPARWAFFGLPAVFAAGFLAWRNAHGMSPASVPFDVFPINPYIVR